MEELSPIEEARPGLSTVTLGGGCFWCLEAVFIELRGVEMVTSGYAGGRTGDPSYKDVCTGKTGHAEVVQMAFDPDVITLRDLLVIFFHSHDPTTLNEQGPDKGTQYRSIVLYRDEEQKALAEEVMADLQAEGLWNRKPFVTELAPFEVFYPAEEGHQDYYRRNPDKGYCKAVISPKILKLRSLFSDRLREKREDEGDTVEILPKEEDGA